MSSTNTEIVNIVNMESKKKPNRLSAKYSKFATFAFWLFREMKNADSISEDSYNQFCVFANLIGSDVQTQAVFYERFIAETKDTEKLLKTVNKAAAASEKKAKKPAVRKSKKTNVSVSNNDIITQIVLRANNVENPDEVPPPPVEGNQTPILKVKEKKPRKAPVKKPKGDVVEKEPVVETTIVEIEDVNCVEPLNEGIEKKKEKKAKKERAKKPKDVVEIVETHVEMPEEPLNVHEVIQEPEKKKEKKTKKARAKKSKKDVPIPDLHPEQSDNQIDSDPDEDTEEIELSAIEIDDVEYYYDSDENLYDINKNIIGTFNFETMDVCIFE
jgi:hypothetical protein